MDVQEGEGWDFEGFGQGFGGVGGWDGGGLDLVCDFCMSDQLQFDFID